MHTIFEDIRYGTRMLWKHRLATLVCATALALGIGANTAMFSVAEAFLLHSVPFENPDRIVAIVNVRPQQNIDLLARLEVADKKRHCRCRGQHQPLGFRRWNNPDRTL